MARYPLDLRYDRRARQLVRTSWALVRDHAQNARFMLSGPLHVHGDIVEQLATRDQVIGSRALIAAVARLWWDDAKGSSTNPASTTATVVREEQSGGSYR